MDKMNTGGKCNVEEVQLRTVGKKEEKKEEGKGIPLVLARSEGEVRGGSVAFFIAFTPPSHPFLHLRPSLCRSARC